MVVVAKLRSTSRCPSLAEADPHHPVLSKTIFFDVNKEIGIAIGQDVQFEVPASLHLWYLLC